MKESQVAEYPDKLGGMCNIVKKSIRKLESWIEKAGYKGYEPFDGLSSFLRPLTFGRLFGERLLMQLVRQCPVNLRPLLGIKPQESTKGRGYMAWGYLTMYKVTGDIIYRKKAQVCLNWLIEYKSPYYSEYSWGNHFDFSGRSGRYSKHEPIIVWTSLIGQAFLDAYEVLKEERYLRVARSICDWIVKLPRKKTGQGICLSYLANKEMFIHNSNMLGAAMLARTWSIVKDQELLDVAREAMLYSCSRQRRDGAWYYGEDDNQRWIDNFHTGYNLDSLKRYIESTGDKTFSENLRQGFQFFRDNFIEDSGRPKYYHNRAYPVDSQCAAQTIETLSHFANQEKESIGLALKVAYWWIQNMQDSDGHFYYRQYPLGIKAKTPMMHWSQATTYRALTFLLNKICN